MNQGVVGQVLIKKTECKKSRVSDPLNTEIWPEWEKTIFYYLYET
jgi:hypothetical protein